MSWWTDFRDTVQSIGSVVLNYYYPGLGNVANALHSKGSQEQMNSFIGQAAMFGSGLVGGAAGNMSNYGSTLSALSGGGTAAEGFNAAGLSVGQQEAGQTYMSLLQQGYPTETAVQMSGLNPSYAESAGLPTGNSGVTWGDIAASPQFSGQQGTAGAYGSMEGGFGQGQGTFGGGAGNSVGGNMSAASKAAAATGAMPWGSPGNMSTMASGIYGLSESMRMRNLAEQAGQKADPFGPYRQQYADQMSALSADPSLITKQPGYDAGLQAIKRTMASQGYTGSGNMMAALAKYGGDFYNQTMNNYANWGGAGFNPAAGAQLGLQGQQYGIDLAGKSLATIGYGVRSAGG